MNIPTLPPDNLYKFIALTGLFLAVVCFGYFDLRLNEMQRHNVEIRLGKEALDYKVRDWERRVERLRKSVDELSTNITREQLIWLREQLAEQSRGPKDWINQMMELRAKSDLADLYQVRTLGLALVLLPIGVFGVFLSIRGFHLWYHRLQKFQDEYVRAQAKQSDQQGASPDVENTGEP